MSEMFVPAFLGLCFGLLAASGVLTVLLTVGLLPRYAGRFHEAKHILLFENMVILGTLTGSVVTFWGVRTGGVAIGLAGLVIETLYGLFSGMFVGSLAMAIAEMLNAIPVFLRRLQLTNGIRWIVLAIALGKLAGSYLYFFYGIGNTLSN